LRIGLVNQVVPRDQLLLTAESIARNIMSSDASALEYAKTAITRGLDLTLDQGLEMEKRLSAALAAERMAA
jgi:enoyl-CoA hydratase/carnithine racemase